MAPAANPPPVENVTNPESSARRRKAVRPRTNLAFRQRHKQSKRRLNWAGYVVAICGVAAVLILAGISVIRPRSVEEPDADVASRRLRNGEEPASREKGGHLESPHEPAPVAIVPSTPLLAESSESGPTPSESSTNVPATESSMSSPSVDTMTEGQRRQFTTLLREARGEIAAQQFAIVRKQLKQAADLAATDADLAKVDRLKMLSDYVAEFWSAFKESLADLEGVELSVGDEQVLVVSADDSRIVIRERGKNRVYSIDSLPPNLVLIIADRRFNQDAPSTKVFKGAYMALEPTFGKERALQLWRSAASEGVDIGDLELVLDDQY